MSLTFDYINSTLNTYVQTRETDLKTQITSLGSNPSTADLLGMQQKIQSWTMMTDMQSTVVKQVADALKGIIQKSG
ncbi:EscF/YscF/HrpA family type III secretion system needle major subunit [Parachitinimonas caeni]|uniref:EscF/YscF/HrpA family type III secretion system needle major subunit n=1 Tax=Parachitinimonas caeni TaxID=3031301 RepID=A0ABT7DTW6_9NEIS|nr:EscF/YscF/HrpA family type III secretion system needle major subunit [Parachitinimonas caeni]MDK2123476.1 EscF/YscF/HrpA family type III secretion system needle major subunit [Parachitinimonas caeni]